MSHAKVSCFVIRLLSLLPFSISESLTLSRLHDFKSHSHLQLSHHNPYLVFRYFADNSVHLDMTNSKKRKSLVDDALEETVQDEASEVRLRHPISRPRFLTVLM